MRHKIIGRYAVLVKWFEIILAFIVLGGVLIFAFWSMQALSVMDWTTSGAFYELIYRVILLVIGLELVRMLLTHEVVVVLELLAFVIARKILMPDLAATDIFIAALGFVALLAARKYLISADEIEKVKTAHHDFLR